MGTLLNAIPEPNQGTISEIHKNKKPEEMFQQCLQIMTVLPDHKNSQVYVPYQIHYRPARLRDL